MRRFLFLPALLFLFTCTGNQNRDKNVTVWIAPEHQEFKRQVFQDGCRFWNGFGQTCNLVDHRGDADITVTFTEDDCGKWLAYDVNNVNGWPTIVVYAKCFVTDKNGNLPLDVLRRTFAHEFGHALGLEHVPPGCDLDSYVWSRDHVDPNLTPIRHPSGKVICGPAIMNPSINNSLNAITEADKMNFDIRTRANAVLSPTGPTLGEPTP